jgi:hypothetical protein
MARTLVCLSVATIVSLSGAGEPAPSPKLVAQPDAFRTLVNPQCSHCRDEAKHRAGELRDDDRVLCWIRGYSDGGAIPFRFFLNPYRVISDTYGVFVSDPDAGFARGFAPSLDFTFHGWRNGVMVMKHKDGTLYSCLSGMAFAGPKKGTRLKAVPTLGSTWGEWMKRYPQAVAYRMFEKYQPVALPAKPAEGSLKSRGPVDMRLPAETMVLGVYDGGKAHAYVWHDSQLTWSNAKADHVVLSYPPTKTASAYRPIAHPPAKSKEKPRRVSLIAPKPFDTRLPWVDKETLSDWDYSGRCIRGTLKGWALEWIDSTQVKWFAWAAEYPETSLHRFAEDKSFRRAKAKKGE